MNGDTPFGRPSIRCQGATGAVNPSWSADSRELAYGAGDGVHVLTVPAGLDCGATSDRVLAPGGADPAFGRADVDMSQAPGAPGAVSGAPAGGVGAGTPGTIAVTKLKLRPRTFRAGGKGTKVTYTLRAPARVKLTVTRRRKVVRTLVRMGKRGANHVRVRGRGLKPGRYALTARADGAARTARFRVVRR